ncbi:hypothetical protein RO3G_12261 [Rhizopus delemar RA 99-880]|uniref:Uncharacterized protein n=1 Tax=Rhizopus delemar (strain RA 99-880 / ATCC MYA-4621 / FGSC 9543 / NRRL 43880) TaxID=246409 RepID=I1CGH0_RHIO9|nr:hypothetical protein RO3G_12261 [Rhizopus delemar RA 99-880]|eukprot:EIE87550.1 hypothetical protein RO3G_12261 [Rhizopus delemar RA 99-880]
MCLFRSLKVKREEDGVVRHVEAEEMKALVDDYRKSKTECQKASLTLGWISSNGKRRTPKPSVMTKVLSRDAGLTEAEAVLSLWQSILGTVDRMNARPDQMESSRAHYVSLGLGNMLDFTQNRVDLASNIQWTCYEDVK